jgi:hypothetical protein
MSKPIRGVQVVGALVMAGVMWGTGEPVQAQVSVQITPPHIVVPGPPPSPGHIWIERRRRWDGRRYVWVPGHWERRHSGYWQERRARHWERERWREARRWERRDWREERRRERWREARRRERERRDDDD